MAYVIGLFDARAQADAAVSDLKTAGIGDVDYSLSDREHTLTGWLARLFGMQHDAGTLQSHGVPVQDAQW